MRLIRDFFRRGTSKSFFKYIGVGYTGAILNMILSLLLIKFLTPIFWGKVTLGKSIFQSFEYSHLGLRNGLDRWLPHCEGQNDRNIIFSIAYLFSFFISFFFVFFWMLYYPNEVLFYLCFSLSGLLYTLVTIYRIYYRCLEQKRDFINISFYVIIFPLLIQIIGLFIWGGEGFVISHLLSYALSLFICCCLWKIKICIVKDKIYPVLKKLLSSGFLLFLSAIINFLATTGDRFFIVEYWGLELLGVYGVIMFFFAAFSIFSLNYTELIMNKIILSPSLSFIMKHILGECLISFFLVLLSYPLLPIFVEYFMPQYIDYLSSIKLILLAVVPYAALPILNYSLHALDKRNILLIINIVCTSIYFVILLFILSSSRKLEQLIYLKIFFNVVIVVLTFICFVYNIRKTSRT
jgi:O-antigen/teichoic acid export membrane protein